MEISRVQPQAWNCIICLDAMDGKNNKLIATSKRCLHIFHEVCVKNWINMGANTCPLCKLQDFHIEEVLINHEYPKQYDKWNNDKEGYSYQKAFDDEYPLNDPTREQLKPEDILIQKELRGLPRRETLSMSETLIYMEETLNKAKENRHGKKDLFESSVLNALKAQRLALDGLEKKFDLSIELCKYKQKISALDHKANDIFKDNDRLLMNLSLEFSRGLFEFSKRFQDKGTSIHDKISRYSTEEYQEILKGIDRELDAFVENQPQVLKNALGGYIPADLIIHQNQEQAPQPDQGLSRKTLFKIAFVTAGALLIYCLWRAGDPKKLTQDNKTQKPDL